MPRPFATRALALGLPLGLLLALPAAVAQPACSADFSVLGLGALRVEIHPKAEGGYEAVVNDATTNPNGQVVDETVRAGLDLDAAPDSSAFRGYNSAERSLVHLHGVLAAPATRQLVRIPFEPADVRRMRTYDLLGKTDKFGGEVLLEAYGDGDALLGRVVRRVFVATCR